jgi:RNA polymerase sigma factor (sigma-70 family)
MDRNSAYYELLERYRPMVWRLCWRHARGDWDRCNDLVQEVSIALWEHFGQLRHDATTQEQRAWVRWQTRSVLDLQRRKQHLVTEPFTDAMTETLVDEPESDKEKVAEVIELLTPEEQRLVRLQLCGYNAAEVAQIMHLTRDAVYQRMHRIIVKARNALLVLFLLLLTSTLTVAVVPQWRQKVFRPHGEAPQDSTPKQRMELQDPQAALLRPWVEVDTFAVAPPHSGHSWQYRQDEHALVYIRYAGTYAVRAVMHNVDSSLFAQSQIPYNMFNVKRQAALAATMAVLTTAASAQMGYDFKAVSPQGDTLFCTVTDSAQHHVSVRGDESVWNAPYIHYNDTLVIPSSVEHNGVQFTVSALGDSAFYNHGEITAAVIPVSVTAIGGMAFASTGINELVVPDSVNTIDAKAFGLVPNVIYHGAATGAPWGALTVNGFEEDGLFYLDSSRTAVTACRPWVTQAVLPASVRSIGRYAFSLSQLESITLPEGLETIGNSAFQSCSRLGSVVIPSTVTEIGRYAFYNAFRTSSEATVTIADAECSIGQGAFCYSNMSAIDLGSRVTSIGQDAFASLGRTDSIIVPNSCTYLAARAFCYNYSGCLRKVHLPDNLDTIRDELLHGCTGLEEVNIPQSVVYIGEMALAELFSVMELTLPAGLTYIGPWALGSCTNISEMTSLAVVPPQACDNSFEDLNANLMLTVPCGSVEGYRTAPYWGDFQNIYDDCEAVPEVEPSEVIIKASWRRIIVEGAEGEVVTVYDAEGRQVTDAIGRAQCILRVPDAGLYLVKVGKRPAVKVVSR